MEKKQLDLDAPLLSVRRFSSTLASLDGVNKKKNEKSLPHRQHSLPVCKSDCELGEVTKPVAVPFLWEQIPGRAKSGNESEAQSPVEPSNTPRLPPGRALDVPKLLLEEAYQDLVERMPRTEASPLNDRANLWERLNKGVNAEGECGSESEDDEYSDAPDTLSPTETFSRNCSVSDLSGYGSSDVKPCGTFSADTQTRDFMMNRFLPAAKAMVLDAPQYVAKKQSMTPERPRPVRKEVTRERIPRPQQQRSAILPHYGQYGEDVESEVEVDEYNDSGKKSVKFRGLFSRFCLKNSLCLLNPVPGMKVRTQVPTSSAKKVSRLARTAYSGPLTQISDKHSWGASCKQKFDSRARSQSHELHKVKSKVIGESNRSSYSGDLRMMRGMSPYRSVSRGGISPYRIEGPLSPFREELRFLGIINDVENVKAIKGHSNFQDVSCQQRYKQASGSMTPTVEKTLYIDSVNIIKLPLSESISSGAASLKDSYGNFGTSVDSSTVEETATAESFIQDIRCTDILEGGGSIPTADTPSSARVSNVRSQVDRMEGLRHDQGRDQRSGSSDCSKLNTNRNIDTNNELIPKADDQGILNVGSMLSPLPPPLPKSPSESWLWRTLPSISLRHPFTQFHPKKQHDRASNTGTKWETIVKTSNVHHDHVRYSEELVPHVSQHSKT